MKTVAEYRIQYSQILNEKNELNEPLPGWATAEWLQEAYQHMMLTRIFDQKAVALQRTGQMGTYPSCLGQEAVGVAIGMALADDDVFVPYYRDQGAYFLRNHKLEELLLYWGGDERGSSFGPKQDFPVCVPIATQVTHAAGAAAALKLKGESGCVMVTVGDGGTSKGDFMESLNVAGAWQLPLIVIVNNNQWAISVHRSIQCGAPTLAQKAIAAGIHGVQVDGNDVVATHEAILNAKEHADEHKGATLIEAISYRLADHTTADDASRYREADEVKRAWEIEPVKRLRQFLISLGWWTEAKEKDWTEQCQKQVEQAVARYLAFEEDTPESMFDHLYSEWPSVLDEQLDILHEKVERMTKRHTD